ncbi:MAG: Fic family protein [Odoribacteraceae bacterium]|jgi:Fic family protein|nr:Fic family protein [Odoribacteraceae bacterium]
MNAELKKLLGKINALKVSATRVAKALDKKTAETTWLYLVWTYVTESSLLEGLPTMTDDVVKFFWNGTRPPNLSKEQIQEMVNEAAALSLLKTSLDGGVPLSTELIRELHATLASGIDDRRGGKFRQEESNSPKKEGVLSRIIPWGKKKAPEVPPKEETPEEPPREKYVPPMPSEIPALMEHALMERARMTEEGVHSALVAIYLHAEICRITPFDEENDRVARLVMNYHLLSDGFPLTIVEGNEFSLPLYVETLKIARETGILEPFQIVMTNVVHYSLEGFLRIAK